MMASTISSISTSLVEDMIEGEPEDVITLRDAIIVVAKESVSDMQDASFSYKHGKLKMKNIMTTDMNMCSQRQVLFSIIFSK